MPSNAIWSDQRRHQLAFLGILLIFIGLIASKFTISLGMICLILAGVVSTDFKRDWARLRAKPAYWLTTGIFWLVLLSGLHSSNLTSWLSMLRVALPYLLLPIAFGLLPPFSKKKYHRLLYIFVGMMLISSIGVFINYLLHYSEIQEAIQRSKAIPTPQDDHIRFSLLVCLSLFAGGWLLQERFYWRCRGEQSILIFALLFLWAILHVLSVRSGLLAFYLGIGIMIARLIIVRKRYWLGLGLFVMLLSVPVLAYYLLPSFKTKVELMRYNWGEYHYGRIGNLSDTQRLLSYQVALEIGAKHPLVGVGLGDLKDAQRAIYERDYPEQRVMYPHNQLLSFYAGLGVLGLLAFLLSFFYPLFHGKNYQHPYFILFFSLIFTSFLTENTIFIAIGTAIHLVFLLLHLNTEHKETDTTV